MPTVTTSDGVEIFYKDWGSGQPIVFSHGWPLSADDWDAQMLFFLAHGYRVIAHDRRGHGRSTQIGRGHDMDHYADDLTVVTNHLDLKDAIHVGHSTGGAIAQILAIEHAKRFASVVLSATWTKPDAFCGARRTAVVRADFGDMTGYAPPLNLLLSSPKMGRLVQL